MKRLALAVLAFLLVTVGVALTTEVIAASPSTTGPSVLVDQGTASPGDRVRVSVEGFDAPYVTVSICGNQARHGSTDCDMVGSKGFELRPAGALTWTELVVTEPPAPCPCVIRVSTPLNDIVSAIPFVVEGHPIEELSGPTPDDPLVEVIVRPEPAAHGLMSWMRASLGGASEYDVTVSVRNLTTDTLRRVVLDGSVGRDQLDVTTSFDLKAPGVLGPGQTSTQTVQVRLPAPTVGSFVWRVTANGAGPSVTTYVNDRPVPWMLIVLVGFLLIDVVLLVMRWRIARRARAAASAIAADFEQEVQRLLEADRADALDVPATELVDAD